MIATDHRDNSGPHNAHYDRHLAHRPVIAKVWSISGQQSDRTFALSDDLKIKLNII